MNLTVVKVPLEELVASRGKSMYWLAKETNTSYTALWNLKEGRTQSVNLEILEKICNALNCTPNDLLLINSTQNKSGN
jgi:putative transcriptional regulator